MVSLLPCARTYCHDVCRILETKGKKACIVYAYLYIVSTIDYKVVH